MPNLQRAMQDHDASYWPCVALLTLRMDQPTNKGERK